MTAPVVASRVDAAHLSPRLVTRLRRSLQHELADQAVQAAEHRTTTSELTGNTDVDSVLEREIAETGADRAEAMIVDIQHALDRLRAGTYGTCERCGAPIPAERLEAIPHARRCVVCQERRSGLLG